MNIKGNIVITGKADAARLANFLQSLGGNWHIKFNGDSIELCCDYTILN